MSVGVGFTHEGWVVVRNLDTDDAWLISVEVARASAAEWAGLARAGRPSAQFVLLSPAGGFRYTGAPADYEQFARDLREMADAAAPWAGAAGHA